MYGQPLQTTHPKFWFACYRDRTGRQIRKSTKLLDKAAALKIAVELERVENMAKTGMAAVSQFQRVVKPGIERSHRETLPSQSVEEYFAAWLPIAERRLGEISAKSYRLAVRRFLNPWDRLQRILSGHFLRSTSSDS